MSFTMLLGRYGNLSIMNRMKPLPIATLTLLKNKHLNFDLALSDTQKALEFIRLWACNMKS